MNAPQPMTCACEKCSCGGECDETCACGNACACQSGQSGRARRHYVVGLDCSTNAASMMKWIAKEIVREGDAVQLVHVIPGVYPSDASTYAPMLDDFFPLSMPDAEKEAHWRSEAVRWIEENISPIFDDAKIPFQIDIVAYDTNTSSIGEVLCEKADLINDTVAVIVASSGKGRVKEFFVGSTCNYCLHKCKKPVIVYKPQPKTDEEMKEENAKATSAEKSTMTAEAMAEDKKVIA